MNNWRILRAKNAKFSGYYFYLKTKICGDFQICISVPLSPNTGKYLPEKTPYLDTFHAVSSCRHRRKKIEKDKEG